MIPCVICGVKYDLDSVGTVLIISTGVCVSCYLEGAASSSAEWCFAKLDSYDPDTKECRELCPDRKFCAILVNKIRSIRETSGFPIEHSL